MATVNTLASLANSEWTYSNTITGLKVQNITGPDGNLYANTVVQTYWTYSATTPDGHTGTFNGATPFTLGNVHSDTYSFTPFTDLEEANVLSWIINSISGSYADHINEKIVEQINNQINVISEPGLPWAPANTANTPA